jgi:hypothetical protein
VAKYGPVEDKSSTSKVNSERMVKIQQANKARGAQLPFPDEAAQLKSVHQKKAMALFDVCWSCFPGNYGRYIKQLDPDATSVGYWQQGPKHQEFGRFARGLEHSTGKDKITLQLDPKFGAPGKRALVRVWYLDHGNGRWAIGYAGAKVSAVQNRDSQLWKMAEVNITLTKQPTEDQITLFSIKSAVATAKNLTVDDEIFSLLEVLLLYRME